MHYSALAAAALLAGCSAGEKIDSTFNAQAKAELQAAKERSADQRAVRSGFAPGQPAALEISSVDAPDVTSPGAALPAAEAEYRYIGRWAASAASCGTHAWQFRSRKLTTADGVACDLPEVAVVPSGYELSGTCKSKRARSEQTFKLSFDEQRKTMRVAGAKLTAANLLYCGV